jgi:hypothetical protein
MLSNAVGRGCILAHVLAHVKTVGFNSAQGGFHRIEGIEFALDSVAVLENFIRNLPLRERPSSVIVLVKLGQKVL